MQWTDYLLQAEGVLIAMKGQVPVAELEQLERVYSVASIVVPGIDAEYPNLLGQSPARLDYYPCCFFI
jgi:hypothetical protein